TVIRDGAPCELPLKLLVPGDLVILGAGDMIPADIRLLSAKDLFINQATLTGESLPVEKSEKVTDGGSHNPLERDDCCFLGTNVVSGSATAMVVGTGSHTYFGSLAHSIADERPATSFDKGINR